MADDFKVSVETLHTTKVKEINYEGEETYQDKPSLSKTLSELAQRIDFNEDEDEAARVEEDTANPSKKSSRRWPWEYTHSKLKQALTEVSVLSDILHVLQHHRQYMTIDPVYVPKGPGIPVRVQFVLKQKAVKVAASILRKGADQLHCSSSQGDREFHRAIHELRKRWRLRRTSVGVLGDLSYHSAGSLYTQSVQFEVHKGVEGSGVEDVGSKDILSVVVPQELRGKSEVVIFISDQPVREVVSLDAIMPDCIRELHRRHAQLVPWEQKLVSAQNVLFNEELFAQLAKEAFDQKSDLQGEVLTDRINIPLSTSTWLSVLLVREYEGTDKNCSAVVQLPEPHWELSVAFKQLLRTNHRFVATARPPRPSNSSSESPQFRSAGSGAMSASNMKQFEPDFSLYKKLLRMAKHIDNEKKLNQWLNELCVSNSEPRLLITCIPSLSLSSSQYHIAITSKGTSLRWLLDLTLSESKVSLRRGQEGVAVTLPVDRDKVERSIKRQCVLYMKEVVKELVDMRSWRVLIESTLPHTSLSFLKTNGVHSQSCDMTIEEPNGRKRMELLIGFGYITANICNISHLTELPAVGDLGSPLESRPVAEDTPITLKASQSNDPGIVQQLVQLFNNL